MEIENSEIENPNKKRKINTSVFILNRDSLDDYYLINPDELIIIYSSNKYSHQFMETIIKAGTKANIQKIITSDSVIIKYIKYIENIFENLFPNCKTIKINSLENDFNLISRIIDDIKIIKNIEYTINDYIYYNDSSYKYKFFTNSFLTGNLVNIKYIKIINNINIEPTCTIEKKIINNIIDFDLIEKNNKLQLDTIIKYNISSKSINYIYFEYIDKQKNIYYNTRIINIIDIDFLRTNFIL
jgi:hypothetical protein